MKTRFMKHNDFLSKIPCPRPRHQGLGMGEFIVYGFISKSEYSDSEKGGGVFGWLVWLIGLFVCLKKKKKILRPATGTEK